MSRPRDSQRAKLYKAERLMPDWAKLREFPEVPACQRYVNSVTRSKTWRRLYAEANDGAFWSPMAEVTVEDGRGSGSARAGRSTINLPRWARGRVVILHELAHVMTPRKHAAHGREFANNYLKLLRVFVSKAYSQQMRQMFRLCRVKHIVTRPQPLLRAAEEEP